MTGEELASYYRAAVEFIDPRLGQDCPVEDICAAAKARQRALAAHGSETARLELDKIAEALRFIERIHPEVSCLGNGYAAADAAPDSPTEQLPAENVASQAAAAGLIAETVTVSMPDETVAAGETDKQTIEPAVSAVAAQLTEITAEPEIENVATPDEPGGTASPETGDAAIEEEYVELVIGPAPKTQDGLLTNGNGLAAMIEMQTEQEPASEAIPASCAALEAISDVHAADSPLQPSRREFIENLQARREQHALLDQQEAAQLLTELGGETESEERIRRILDRVPDVQTSLDREMQAEEADRRPLDFRSMIEKAQSADGQPLKPAPLRRVRTGEIMQRPRRETRIPEEYAAPVLMGILLILWQFAASLLAGYALCRLLVWPWGIASTGLDPLRVVLACVVALGTAAAVAIWFRHYRLRTHRLALPVHVTALSMLMLILPWQIRSVANAYQNSPPILLWGLFIAAWLVATVACWFHDLRVPPLLTAEESAQPRRNPAKATKPAIPQPH